MKHDKPVVLLVAPSGGGKTTVTDGLNKVRQNLAFDLDDIGKWSGGASYEGVFEFHIPTLREHLKDRDEPRLYTGVSENIGDVILTIRKAGGTYVYLNPSDEAYKRNIRARWDKDGPSRFGNDPKSFEEAWDFMLTHKRNTFKVHEGLNPDLVIHQSLDQPIQNTLLALLGIRTK